MRICVKDPLMACLMRLAQVKGIVEAADVSNVTLVGLYDREDLDLAWTSPRGRVALLGDAAHPQSPMQGQGVNMALFDGYSVAARLVAVAHRRSGAAGECRCLPQMSGGGSIRAAFSGFVVSAA